MNPYNLAVLFFAFGTFLLALFVLLKRRDKLGIAYFAFSLCVAAWGVGFSVMTNYSASYQTALVAIRFSNASAAFLTATWVHFILMFLGFDQKRKPLTFFLYGLAAVIGSFVGSPLFVSGLSERLVPGFLWYPKPGIIYHLHTASFFTAVPYGFVEMWRARKKTRRESRVQLDVFIMATLFGFVGGALTFLPVYGIAFPQYGVFLMPFYPFLMTFAMIRHHLFDLEEIFTLLFECLFKLLTVTDISEDPDSPDEMA